MSQSDPQSQCIMGYMQTVRVVADLNLVPAKFLYNCATGSLVVFYSYFEDRNVLFLHIYWSI